MCFWHWSNQVKMSKKLTENCKYCLWFMCPQLPEFQFSSPWVRVPFFSFTWQTPFWTLAHRGMWEWKVTFLAEKSTCPQWPDCSFSKPWLGRSILVTTDRNRSYFENEKLPVQHWKIYLLGWPEGNFFKPWLCGSILVSAVLPKMIRSFRFTTQEPRRALR